MRLCRVLHLGRTVLGVAILFDQLGEVVKFIFVALALTLSGCCQQEKLPSTSGNVFSNEDMLRIHHVEKLFEKEDCTVYRFFSKDEWQHFVTCPRGETTKVHVTRRQTGKIVRYEKHPKQIQTVETEFDETEPTTKGTK